MIEKIPKRIAEKRQRRMTSSDGEKFQKPSGDDEKFWAENPLILFHSFTIIPSRDQSINKRLNALTRLIILITAVLFLFDISFWATFGLLGLILVLVLKAVLPNNEESKENFTVTPTYFGADFEQTAVAPLFAEEWQIYPPTYDLVEHIPQPDTFEDVLTPQAYPYGQYLTKTNLLPGDEEAVRMMNGSVSRAREYANSLFLRNDLARRENQTRIFKKSLARRFRHNCNDTFSPYQSY